MLLCFGNSFPWLRVGNVVVGELKLLLQYDKQEKNSYLLNSTFADYLRLLSLLEGWYLKVTFISYVPVVT